MTYGSMLLAGALAFSSVSAGAAEFDCEAARFRFDPTVEPYTICGEASLAAGKSAAFEDCDGMTLTFDCPKETGCEATLVVGDQTAAAGFDEFPATFRVSLVSPKVNYTAVCTRR